MECIEYRDVLYHVRFFFMLVNPIILYFIIMMFGKMILDVIKECTGVPEKLKPEESIARDMKELVKIMKRK